MQKKFNVAIQTYNHTENYPNCLNCNNIITTPLCPHCLAKGFTEWLKSHKELEKDTTHKIKHLIKNLPKNIGEKCAICRRKMHTCAYCFTEYLYSLVKEAGAGPKVLSEFLFIFNFDFKKTGYYHDLEALGGY